MKFKKLVLSFGFLWVMAGGVGGCSTMHTTAGTITDIRATDFSKTMKAGESCATYVFGLIGPLEIPRSLKRRRRGVYQRWRWLIIKTAITYFSANTVLWLMGINPNDETRGHRIGA